MEEISQLALVVVFAAVVLVSGQLFMEHRVKKPAPPPREELVFFHPN
jgi:hypothetical protein